MQGDLNGWTHHFILRAPRKKEHHRVICENLRRGVVSRREFGMSQMGFFDADKRLSVLSAKGDPLVSISTLVPWEMFRGDIEAVVLTADGSRKGNAGRKPIDALVLFAGVAVSVQFVG